MDLSLLAEASFFTQTLPRYMALSGAKNGAVICLFTMGFAMLARVMVLALILMLL